MTESREARSAELLTWVGPTARPMSRPAIGYRRRGFAQDGWSGGEWCGYR